MKISPCCIKGSHRAHLPIWGLGLPNLDGVGTVLGVNVHDLGMLGRLDGIGRGRHGWANRSGWYTAAQLP
jgi:hypothetical protein